VGRVTASLLALLLGAAAAVALASCGGGGDARLLPGGTASEITANLDRVKQMVGEGECVGAEDATQLVATQIDELGGVDRKLKQALREGADRLGEVVSECIEEPLETIEQSEPATAGTTGKPSKQEGKAKPPKTTPTAPEAPTTPTQTTPEAPPAAQAEPPVEGGGTETPSGGVGPGSPVGEGQE
jgi:hypothetical protein